VYHQRRKNEGALMVIRLWHNRSSRAVPRDEKTGEPLYGYPLEITPGNQLVEVHHIDNWSDEPMLITPREVASMLNRVCETFEGEHVSLQVADVVQIGNRFWACEVLDPAKHMRRWSGLQLPIRMMMSWIKLSHSANAPCDCPECLALVA
jgi:hypothetical protein